MLKTKLILFVSLLVVGCVNWGLRSDKKPCPEGHELNSKNVCIKSLENGVTPTPSIQVKPRPDYENLPERFTWGQRILFSSSSSPSFKLSRSGLGALESGKTLYLEGEYFEAARQFGSAYEDNENNPEPLILYNNSLALQKDREPITLVVVVPGDNKPKHAAEILRGVAQAQNRFNANNRGNGNLLEVIIANDGNSDNDIELISETIAKDSSVLGIIGHNSSDSSLIAVDIYQDNNIAMISPTSTSNELSNNDFDVFFRTVPNDNETGKKLAEYAKDQLELSKVMVLYNSDSPYSRSIKSAFQGRFEEEGGNVTIKDLRRDSVIADFQELVREGSIQGVVLFPDTNNTSIAIDIAEANAEFSESERVKLLGGDSLYSPDTLSGGDENIEGLVLAVPWFRNSPDSKDFSKTAKIQWKGEVSWRTAMSYDATQAFLKVVADDAALSDIVQRLSNVRLSASETSGAPLEFSEGEPERDILLVRIKNSDYHLVSE